MTTVIVKYQFEGLHCWDNCPIEEVSFLKDKHRHVFHVELEKEVSHADRDVEIIMLKRKAEAFSRSRYDYGRMSCEMIAKELLDKFKLKTCTVLEDGENGAKVYA